MKWKHLFVGMIVLFSMTGGYASIKATEVKMTGEAHGLCTAINGFDCATVAKSSYSEIIGIPVSVLGLAAYIFFLLAIFVYAFRPSSSLLNAMIFASAFGLLFSLYLTSVEAFVLHAWCLYCVISQISIFLIFIAVLGLRWREDHHEHTMSDIHQ